MKKALLFTLILTVTLEVAMALSNYQMRIKAGKRDEANNAPSQPAGTPAFGAPTGMDQSLAQVLAQLRAQGQQTWMRGAPAAGGSGGFSSGGSSQGSTYGLSPMQQLLQQQQGQMLQGYAGGGGASTMPGGAGGGLQPYGPPALQPVVPTIPGLQSSQQPGAGLSSYGLPKLDNGQGQGQGQGQGLHVSGLVNNQLGHPQSVQAVQPDANGDWTDPITGMVLHQMTPNGDGTYTGVNDAGQTYRINQMGNIGTQGVQGIGGQAGTFSAAPGSQPMLQTAVPTLPGQQSANPPFWVNPQSPPPSGGGGGGGGYGYGGFGSRYRRGGGSMKDYLGGGGLVNWNIGQ